MNNIIRTDMISKGTIDTSIGECIQPENINVLLNCYQLKSIYAMTHLENDSLTYDDSNYVKSSFGILCNKSGSGKSFCILGLIAHNQNLILKDRIVKTYTDNLCIISKSIDLYEIKCNLIVSTSHLLHTIWYVYLKSFTKLSFTILKKDDHIDWNDISQFDCVLCSEIAYNDIITQSKDILWNRVIFDEADSICIPSCKKPNAKFIWFVTSSIKNLLFPNGVYWKQNNENNAISRVIVDGIKHNGWIKQTFKALEKCNDERILNHIFVKIPDCFIDEVLCLPKEEHHYYKCKSPYYVEILYDIIPENCTEFLNSNDYKSIMSHYDINSEHINDMIKSIYDYIEKNLKNSLVKLNYLNSLELNKDEVRSNNQKIQKIKYRIKSLKDHMKLIDRRLKHLNADSIEDDCPICMLHLQNNDPCLLVCCKQFICFQCVTKCVVNNMHNCPLCRTPITENHIIKFMKSYDDLKTKMELLDEIIKKQNAKILIFSSNENSLKSIQKSITNSAIKTCKLVRKVNAKLFDDFNNDKYNILLMNSTKFSLGINLEKTTDIILFHKMNSELSNQIIARAQRIGRTCALQIHHLLYQNEFKNTS